MKIRSMLSIAGILAALSGVGAFASPVVFDFSPAGPGGDFGTSSQVFTSGIYSLTAYGFKVGTPDTSSNLYHKYTLGNPAETGLGITADGDHEIPQPYYVQLDVQALIDAGFTSITFKLGSLQTGEEANIYSDTSAGSFLADSSLLTTLTGGPVEQWFTTGLTTRYFNITGGGAAGADPVLELVSVNQAPDEASTILLFGVSLLGLVAVQKRRSVRR